MRQFDMRTAKERLKMEEHMAKEFVNREFQTWDPDDPVARAMHEGPPSMEHVFGGTMSTAPCELQLVQAWRPSAQGAWQLAQGVVHRVHHEDNTVTVQFLPEQHRCRLPFTSVKPQLDVTPVYPTVRLAPGERLPTRSELQLREHNAAVLRQLSGLGPDAPLPGEEDPMALRAGEHLGADLLPVVEGDHWGLPAPTLDALRNRSIPAAQVTAVYGRHFYTELYRNRFYPSDQRRAPQLDDGPGAAAPRGRHGRGAPCVVSHRYIPLNGPKLEQNLSTGAWRPVVDPVDRPELEGPGFLG